MKKRFRVLPTGAGLEALLNELYMAGYVVHTATDTMVIMEDVTVSDGDMRRSIADADQPINRISDYRECVRKATR